MAAEALYVGKRRRSIEKNSAIILDIIEAESWS
jgi:hypothetical protein